MSEFQNAAFVPFDFYVQKARASSAASHRVVTASFNARRAYDFPAGLEVIEVPAREVPAREVTEFADTEPIPLPEVTYLDACEFEPSTDDIIASKLHRVKNYIAQRAFAECLHNGYFPPRCQECKI